MAQEWHTGAFHNVIDVVLGSSLISDVGIRRMPNGRYEHFEEVFFHKAVWDRWQHRLQKVFAHGMIFLLNLINKCLYVHLERVDDEQIWALLVVDFLKIKS